MEVGINWKTFTLFCPFLAVDAHRYECPCSHEHFSLILKWAPFGGWIAWNYFTKAQCCVLLRLYTKLTLCSLNVVLYNDGVCFYVSTVQSRPRHTHTPTHKHTHGLLSLWGLSIDLMIFILYKLYILSPYTNPTPKPTHHRKLSAFLHFQKNSFCMIYKLVYPWGPLFRSPLWHESPWVCVHSGWSPHRDRKTWPRIAHTHKHTHTHTHIPALQSWHHSLFIIALIKYNNIIVNLTHKNCTALFK